jgi:hypothetical protein
MTNGVAIIIKIADGKAISKLQCNNSNSSELALALAHLESLKLQVLNAFNKLMKKD